MFPEKKKKSKKEKVETTDPEPIDILVDVIIGFMERSTNYLRTVGSQVFGLLSESVTSTTVDLILTVSGSMTTALRYYLHQPRSATRTSRSSTCR